MKECPTLWLLAGGNGAGKSTFYREMLQPLGLPFVNADVIARHLDPNAPEDTSYLAAAIAEKFRSSMLEAGGSFCFETVFSHESKIDFVALAKSHGYTVNLVYIDVGDSSLNAARVSQRVSEGGHNVPHNKIKSRIPRTRQNIITALPLMDTVFLLDNASHQHPLQQLAIINNGVLKLRVDAAELPDWAEEMLRGAELL